MLEKNMYRFVNALLLMACCLLCLGKEIGISKVSWIHMGIGLVVLVLATTWCQLGGKGRMMLSLSVLVAFIVTNMVVGSARTFEHLQNYIGGVWSMGDNAVVWGTTQECIQAAVMGLLSFCIVLFLEQVFWLKVAMAIVWLGVILADLFMSRSFAHAGVVCVILYIILVYVEWTERNWKKERLENNKHYMVRILPFLAVYFCLMVMMPAPEQPYDWKFVKDAYISVREAFLEISRNWIDSDREDFSFGTSGFDGESRLLGGISDDEQTLMIIRGQASLKTNVYLTGKVYDSFDGRGWESADVEESNDRQLDALETLYAVRSHDVEGEAKYLERTGLKIWYEDFRTGYLFTPLKTIKMQDVDETNFTSVGGNYVFREKQGYGLEYNTSFLQLNVDHPVFYEFLETDVIRDEELFVDIQREYFKKTKYTLTDLDNHKKHIMSTYGKDCEISEEVDRWLQEVTNEAETDIDKLKAIEAALQQMVYTKTPGELPKWVDSESEFLDYFLLESKQGYCVYYATAFVLLARAEGLPTRYVEGFCVPVSGTYNVLVTSTMAHAWPEVYIEDVGWVPFEPTPGYEVIRYTPWEIHAEGEGVGQGAEGPKAEDETDEEPLDEALSEELSEEEPESVMQEQNTGNLFKILGLTIIFVIVAGGVIWGLDILLRKRRKERFSPQERFLAEVRMNIRMLAFLGYERADNETLTELRARAWAIMDDESDEDKPEFLFLKYYEEYLYGEYPVTNDILETLSVEKQYLLRLLKKWKPIMYLYCRFRLY